MQSGSIQDHQEGGGQGSYHGACGLYGPTKISIIYLCLFSILLEEILNDEISPFWLHLKQKQDENSLTNEKNFIPHHPFFLFLQLS